MATGTSYCGPLGPSFPSYFSLLKKAPPRSYCSSSYARSLSAYSEAFHRRDICKNRSSVNTSMCSVSFTNRNHLPRHKIGTKQSWQEQAEVYKRNRMEDPNVKCKDGVVSITYCQMNAKKDVEQKPYEFSDGRNFDCKGNLTVPFTAMDTWKETISQAQHKTKTVPSYFDKGSERLLNANHLGQDKVHCDEADGVRNAKVSQKTKSRNNMPPHVEIVVAKPQQKLDSNQVLASNGMHDVTAEDFALDMNKINDPKSSLDKGSERSPRNSNHLGQDKVHCDEADGVKNAKLSQKPKSRNNMPPHVEKRVAKPQQRLDSNWALAPNGMHDVTAEEFALDMNNINGPKSSFDKGSERLPHNSNHLGQDKVHCDEADGVRDAKLSQKPKSRNNMPPNVEKRVVKPQKILDSNQVLSPNGMRDVTAEDFARPKPRNNTFPNVEKRVAKPQKKFDADKVPAPIGMHDVSAEDFAPDLNKVNVHVINGSSQLELLAEQGSTEVVQPKKTPNIRGELVKLYNKVLVVNSVPAAGKVVQLLTNSYRHLVYACDTEVAKIDVKDETPVDHGEIICFSIYCGPEADFGNGKSCIWVDLLDGDGKKILTEFAPFFEDPSIKKVWHNYSFDSHIIENYGLKLSGFHADTMHMARLWDASRRAKGGYSLESLTGDPIAMSDCGLLFNEKDLMGKVSMKTIFGRKKLKKDGTEGKLTTIAPVEVLQREERVPWICYSALDAISTLKLYESLRRKLSNKSWQINGKAAPGKSMLDFYEKYWRPFGKLLAKMETEGMLVDRAYLAEMEKLAKREQEVAADRFRKWASKYCPDAKDMNVGSDTQLRQLLFGGIQNRKNPDECLPLEKTFKVPNVDQVIEEGKKAPLKFRNIKLCKVEANFPVEMYTASGWPSTSIDALKILAGKVSAEFDFTGDAEHLESSIEVEGDIDASMDEISEKQEPKKQEVSNSAYGTALEAFDTEEEGRGACHALAALCEVCAIDSLISNFILPLQGSNISGKDERIHCSLNINTETGRLSARRPNLQNQPALEKDRYKIRQAFIAAPGNSLIVADYGQLELRILAHLTDCKSMLEAFEAGGDFHSRTAMNMYAHIREAVETKQVLLEWDPQPGEDKPPVPLLKDAFGSERRKAKMLNFSIAYGKTPVGLARDWKVSLEEAKRTVELWYKERKEVQRWQEKRKEEARHDRCVRTLLGRARWFPSMETSTYAQRGHIERAAINTPVQGSAADVAMCAMLEISKNERLKELGWRLLLQVHDEVILEGPSESANVAKAIVVECMSKPFDGKNILNVDLAVDAKCAQNWYAAK